MRNAAVTATICQLAFMSCLSSSTNKKVRHAHLDYFHISLPVCRQSVVTSSLDVWRGTHSEKKSACESESPFFANDRGEKSYPRHLHAFESLSCGSKWQCEVQHIHAMGRWHWLLLFSGCAAETSFQPHDVSIWEPSARNTGMTRWKVCWSLVGWSYPSCYVGLC